MRLPHLPPPLAHLRHLGTPGLLTRPPLAGPGGLCFWLGSRELVSRGHPQSPPIHPFPASIFHFPLFVIQTAK